MNTASHLFAIRFGQDPNDLEMVALSEVICNGIHDDLDDFESKMS